MTPTITVLIPVFNRERFVDEAIRSVVADPSADLEVVIVDDGSTDRTPELLREWAARDARIVIVTAPENLGIPGALNLGLQHSRAPYIARLDSDDVMMPERLALQKAILEREPGVTLVSSGFETMDADGNYIATWDGGEPHEVILYLLNFYNIIGGHSQVMYRRADVLAEGGYDCRYPSSEDYALWMRLLRRGRIVTLPLIGMRQRRHERSSRAQYAEVKRSNWTALMSESLGRYLGRTITDDELIALITLWRHDGALGMGPKADATMREAFARFRREHPDRSLQRCIRDRTARQWIEGAQSFRRDGRPVEAVRYVIRALTWSPRMVARSMRRRVLIAFRRSVLGRWPWMVKRSLARMLRVGRVSSV